MSNPPCPTGKVEYRDRISAQLAMAKTDNYRRAKNERRAYRCPQCKSWHLASSK